MAIPQLGAYRFDEDPKNPNAKFRSIDNHKPGCKCTPCTNRRKGRAGEINPSKVLAIRLPEEIAEALTNYKTIHGSFDGPRGWVMDKYYEGLT